MDDIKIISTDVASKTFEEAMSCLSHDTINLLRFLLFRKFGDREEAANEVTFRFKTEEYAEYLKNIIGPVQNSHDILARSYKELKCVIIKSGANDEANGNFFLHTLVNSTISKTSGENSVVISNDMLSLLMDRVHVIRNLKAAQQE